MLTRDHSAMLLHIKGCSDSTWAFISVNYPDGMLWSPSTVAKILSELKAAGMIYQTDPKENVVILPPGERAIDKYLESQEADRRLANLEYEKQLLDVEKLRNEVFDYQATKKRALWGYRLSWVAIILTVITLIQQLMCKKSP